MSEAILSQLVALSNNLARPELDFAILGEGNTSARVDASSFYVKSSGAEMRTITERGFVQVAFDRVLALTERPGLSDAEVRAGLAAAKIDPAAPGHPSVETLLHALVLQLPGVAFVGHTHPTAVNALTCSVSFEKIFSGRLFPDEIVLCGPAPVLVPYTDPGVPLAVEVWSRVQRYLAEYGEQPKVILIQNHGLIALGKTAQQVENITAMMVKTCRVISGTFTVGGPRYLSAHDVERIHTRPDEAYRRQAMGSQG